MLQPIVDTALPPGAAASTPDQFRQTWKNIGLCTEPAARRKAEAAVKTVYAAAGLAAPQKIVWCGSPLSQGLARAIMLDPGFLDTIVKATWTQATNASGEFKNNIAECFHSSMRLFDTGAVKQVLVEAIKRDVRESLTDKMVAAMDVRIRGSLSEAVWNSVWDSVWDAMGDAFWRGFDASMRKAIQMKNKKAFEQGLQEGFKDKIGDCVKTSVWEETMDQAWANIRNNAPSQNRLQAYENIWKSLQTDIWQNVALPIAECVKACHNDSPQRSGYGQHDAYWLAFYAYFRDVHGLTGETEAVKGLLELAETGGWFAPHRQLCWICERPQRLTLDAEGRLHADEGPALSYADGWSLYASAGVVRPHAALHVV